MIVIQKLFQKINKVRKPTLHMNLTIDKNPAPECKSYFGGIPFEYEYIEDIIICNDCHKPLKFVFQFLEPVFDDEVLKGYLYQFFYCSRCQKEQKLFNYSIIHREVYNDDETKTEQYTNKELEVEMKWNSKYQINIVPAYDYPSWDLLNHDYPELVEELNKEFKGQEFDLYMNYVSRINVNYGKTGMKYRGNIENIFPDEVPIDEKGETMELVFGLESIPELNINWAGDFSYVMIFESKNTGDLVARMMSVKNGEAILY